MIIYNNDNSPIIDIVVDDKSYRNRAIMGDHNITLYFSLAEHIELPIGAWCDFEGQTYTLMRPESFKMKHSRNFEYTVIMESCEAKAKLWKFRNPVDGRLKFALTATPREHLQMFVDNMNNRDSGWSIGKCIEGTEIVICYDHAYCYDALSQMASESNTEFEFIGKTVSLCKVEYNKNNPLALSYGRGNGFKPNVGRSNYNDSNPVEILYVQGGNTNIDKSKYGSSELLLPKNAMIAFDGQYFEDENGFNSGNARHYKTDNLGLSIRRSDKQLSSLAEDSLDCSEIYPKRVGLVTRVEVVDETNNFYDIVDYSIPDNLNYEDYIIGGESMSIIFQSGMLAGKEFDVKYIHESKNGKYPRRFEIVPQEIDGQVMPNATFAPKTGDKYAVFGCMLPDAYICDDETKTGASWDMFRTAVRYMYDNEDIKFTFTGELDGIWSKKDWLNIGGKIRLGGYILFSDERFQKEGVLIRITGIKDYINKPHSPVLTLSNSTVSCGFSTTIKELQSEEVLIEDSVSKAMQFTKRRFRDAKETISMLSDALLDNFTKSISPIAIQTMQMLIGDESLQFRFVDNPKYNNPTAVPHNIVYNTVTKQLEVPQGNIQHMTLGIKNVSSSHRNYEYYSWKMPAYTSAVLSDPEKKYYLYAKAFRSTNQYTEDGNSFILSETAISMNAVSDYYHLLVGLLNSEYDGERSFVTLYGFTEILPGRITTDKIVSSNGTTYFDLVNSEIGGKISFKSGSTGYNNIEDRPDLSQYLQDTDGIIEITYSTVVPTASNSPASSWNTDELKKQHIGDLRGIVASGAMPAGTYFKPTKWYRWECNNEVYQWNEITTIPDWFKHLKTTNSQQKMFSLTTPTPPYKVNDIWLNGGIFLKCKTARSSGNFNISDWDDAGIYDNTKTTIDGGIVTSGTVQLAGDNSNILAGITGDGTTDDSVRMWAGTSFVTRANAPFRVLQDGSVVMNNATVNGKIEANENSTFKGSVTIANGKILLYTDGSGCLANGKIYWDADGNINVSNATMTNAIVTGKLSASQGLTLNATTTITAGTYYSPKTIELNNYTSNVFYIKKASNDNVIADYEVKTTIILPSTTGVNILFIFIDPTISCDVGFKSYGQSSYCFQWKGSTLNDVLLLLRKTNSNTYNPWSVLDFEDRIGGAGS